jgi:hypothetical protein
MKCTLLAKEDSEDSLILREEPPEYGRKKDWRGMKYELKDFQTTSAKNILNELTETLAAEFQGSLPNIEEIEAALSLDIATGGES